MCRNLIVLFCVLVSFSSFSQELNARITVNSDNVPGSNKQVFQTLEKELIDFMNQKKWTEEVYKTDERIDCAFTIIISEQTTSTDFKASIQIQAARPVYNSTYLTPIFNFKDDDFSFQYVEFQNLEFNPNRFDSNLVSVLAFYSYMIIGIDSDTFMRKNGTKAFNQAEDVMNQANQSGYSGWSSGGRGVNRFKLINEIQSTANGPFREALFLYHYTGLDQMSTDQLVTKKAIYNAMNQLKIIYNRRPNSPLIRLFMDAKVDEIVDIYSGGEKYDTTKLVDILNKISPTNSEKWNKIK